MNDYYPPSPQPVQPPPQQRRSNAPNAIAGLIGTLVVLGILWYVFIRPGAPAAGIVGGIDQGGWALNYNATTCGDYLNKMTPGEQQAFASWQLNFSRRGDLASAPDADAGTVSRFESAVATECQQSETGPAYPIIGAGVVVYVTDSSYKPTYR